MSHHPTKLAAKRCRFVAWLIAAVCAVALPWGVQAHIVPPEDLHPVAESYRRMSFVLNLNPVQWQAVEQDAATLADGLSAVTPDDGKAYLARVTALIADHTQPVPEGAEPPGPAQRKATASEVFVLSSQAVVTKLRHHLEAAGVALGNRASRHAGELEEARQLWAAFEHASAGHRPADLRAPRPVLARAHPSPR